MISPAVKYCLVALLSQDADSQSNEVRALLSDDFSKTQFAECLKAYGEEGVSTIVNRENETSNETNNEVDVVELGNQGWIYPIRENY